MLDFDITRCSRKCSVTGREIQPGEDVHSVLIRDGSEIIRRDYCTEAWEGPPENCVGWWTTHIPQPPSTGQKMAPPEVLVQLFDQLNQSGEKPELCFILALLLIRRKLLKEEPQASESSGNHWLLKCPMNNSTYELAVQRITSAQAVRLQEELVQLVYGGVIPESPELDLSENETEE